MILVRTDNTCCVILWIKKYLSKRCNCIAQHAHLSCGRPRKLHTWKFSPHTKKIISLIPEFYMAHIYVCIVYQCLSLFLFSAFIELWDMIMTCLWKESRTELQSDGAINLTWLDQFSGIQLHLFINPILINDWFIELVLLERKLFKWIMS